MSEHDFLVSDRCYGLNWDGYKLFALEDKFVCWTCRLKQAEASGAAAQVAAVLRKLQRLALKRRCKLRMRRIELYLHRC